MFSTEVCYNQFVRVAKVCKVQFRLRRVCVIVPKLSSVYSYLHTYQYKNTFTESKLLLHFIPAGYFNLLLYSISQKYLNSFRGLVVMSWNLVLYLSS